MFLHLTPLFFLLMQSVPIIAENWAVLVAGFNDYSMQADICHAYQIVRQHGIPEHHIIVMLWDDIARSTHNLHPGKVYSRPGGPDVYTGIKVDYRGENVSASNFLAVLRGEQTAVKPAADQRVLNSTKDDKVFVMIGSHGDVGTVCFQDGPSLTVKQLTEALKTMHQKGMYKELVFYMDTCHSGSMFSNVTTKQLNVYAATAASPNETSKDDYCNQVGYMDYGPVCLGGTFTVSWMEYIDEKRTLQTVTLEQQWDAADNRTLNGDGVPFQISHPQQFGNLAITGESLSEFFGAKNVQQNEFFVNNNRINVPKGRRISKFDVPLYAAKTEAERQEILKQRAFVDEQMSLLARMFMRRFGVRNLFDFPPEITQLDCHDQVVQFFYKNCDKIPKRIGIFRHSQIFANVCEQNVDAARIVSVLEKFCLQH